MDKVAALRRLEALVCKFHATPIRQARQRAGLSQAALAARLGTPQPVIARWEQGRSLPSWRSLLRIARAVGCRLEIRFVPLRDTPGNHDEASPAVTSDASPSGRSTSVSAQR